ncbi:hypothetical protein GMDG_05337 [Pseudogymnoascus destructans 20631-21]|uniref:Uncharacterized protein n=1 Tax=Pseudogymnoascus destructans (strain ATCC MYA-4855 / 20631-21) TaxID=658429 RepID=L8FMX4_PSED2|nr:hypothetical protein GMDG_05337 [Pseudogymnoascus destructans 20631-21]
MRPAASPGIMPRLAAGAAACADQVWHSGNDCPKRQKSSVIPASPASSRTSGILSPNPLFSRSGAGNSGDQRVTDSSRGVRVYEKTLDRDRRQRQLILPLPAHSRQLCRKKGSQLTPLLKDKSHGVPTRHAILLVSTARTSSCRQVNEVDPAVWLDYPCLRWIGHLEPVATGPVPPLLYQPGDERRPLPKGNGLHSQKRALGMLGYHPVPKRIEKLHNWELSIRADELVKALCDILSIVAISTATKLC